MGASPGSVLLLYSASIFALSLYAFSAAGRDWSRAKTAVIMGGGSAGVALLSGVLALLPARAAKAIGVHLGLLQTLLSTPLFLWRATLAWQSPKKAWLAPILLALAMVSVVTLVAIFLLKPKTSKKTSDKGS